MTRASALVVLWSVLSGALALAPTGFGGLPRAVNSVVFLVAGPGIALAAFLHRRYTLGSGRLLAPSVVAVISETFSLTLLVLTGMALLLVGAWSVPAVVGILTLVAVLVAVWPAGAVPLEQLPAIGGEAPPLALTTEVGSHAALPGAALSDDVVMWS
jgi:hypothetical protein